MRASREVRVAVWAVFAVFAANGFGFGSWASRIPAVRDGLGFSEAEMGLLLLTSAIGSVLALPLSGLVTARLGAARTVALFAGVFAVGYAVACLGVVEGAPLAVRLGLFVGGMGIGVWDAAMNLEGAVVEQRLGRSIMPRFHAGFSLGTVAGAGLGTLAAQADVSLAVHVIAVAVFNFVLVVVSIRAFLATPRAVHGPAGATGDPAIAVEPRHALRDTVAAWREPRTLLIGFVVLAAALTEGAANDWVGLALVDGFRTDDSVGALGLALFLAAMTATRLAGTALIDRLGRVAVLRLSGLAALAGVAVFAVVPVLWVAVLGVLLWGAGAALGFPLGMSAASDDPHRAPSRVAVVSTVGYSAFFVGPALIGFLAEHTGYRNALLVIAVPVALGLAVAGAARPLPTAVGGAPSTLDR